MICCMLANVTRAAPPPLNLVALCNTYNWILGIQTCATLFKRCGHRLGARSSCFLSSTMKPIWRICGDTPVLILSKRGNSFNNALFTVQKRLTASSIKASVYFVFDLFFLGLLFTSTDAGRPELCGESRPFRPYLFVFTGQVNLDTRFLHRRTYKAALALLVAVVGLDAVSGVGVSCQPCLRQPVHWRRQCLLWGYRRYLQCSFGA